jgi:uncharacterized delta-60 repeat protein
MVSRHLRFRHSGPVEALEKRTLLSATLDPSFGSGGADILDYQNLGNDDANVVLPLSDGKLFVAGSADIPGLSPTQRGAIARYNADGSLDMSFGDRGKTTAGGGPIVAAATLPGGKVLVLWMSAAEVQPFFTRLNADGTPDVSFGSGSLSQPGSAMLATPIDVFGLRSIAGMQVLSDGSIVVAGTVGGELLVQRYTPDGKLDTTFGTAGQTEVGFGSLYTVAYKLGNNSNLVVDDAGRINVGVAITGSSGYGAPTYATIVRLLGNGQLDGSFGTGGISAGAPITWDTAVAGMLIDAAGRPVAAVSKPDVTLVRWTSSGALDTGFDSDGFATLSLASVTGELARTLKLTSDGKYLVGGSAGGDAAFFCLTDTGQPDASFGGGTGWTRVNGGSAADSVHVLAFLGDGRIVGAGSAFFGGYGPDNTGDFLITRLSADGSIDSSWGSGGIVETSGFRAGNDFGIRSFPLPNGQVLVASSSTWYGTPQTLSRLNADGSRDLSFGSGGTVVGPQGDYQVTYDADYRNNKLVVLGGGYNWWGGAFRVQRFLADGSSDLTFGTAGTAAFTGSPQLVAVSDVAILPDDRIIVTGTGLGGYLEVIRFTAAGALDTTFDGDGKAVFTAGQPNGTNSSGRGILLSSDGGAYIASSVMGSQIGTSSFSILKLTASGSPDPAFGSNGLAIIPGLPGIANNGLSEIAFQPDGKIVGVGYSSFGSGASLRRVAAAMRVLPGGSVDNSFGSNGVVNVDLGSASNIAYSVVVEPDGRLLLAGTRQNVTVSSSGAVSFRNVGAATLTLPADGKIAPSAVSSNVFVWGANRDLTAFFDATLLTDGKILLTGTTSNGFHQQDVLVARIIDTSFMVSTDGDKQTNEGTAVTLAATAWVPAGQPIASWEWDFDYDGLSFTADASGQSVLFTPDDGLAQRTVAVRAIDQNGAASLNIATAIVDVANVAPQAALLAAAVPVTQPSLVTFTSIHDPSLADTAAGFLYSYDFNNDGDFDDAGDIANSTSASGSFTFPAAGSYTVHGRIADKDGGFSDYTTTVTVNPPTPPPPTVRDVRSPADAYVADGSSAGTNFGTKTELDVRKSSTSGSSRETYLRFPLIGGAAASVIDAAHVRLFTRLSAAGSLQLDLYGVSNVTWSETAINWNNRPAAGSLIASKTVSSTTSAWLDFDVSSYVKQQRAAGATAVSFVLRGHATSTPYAIIASDEATANRPDLQMTEHVGPAVLLSPTTATVPEGGASSTITAKLSTQPAGPVTVTIARASGDPDLSAGTTTLTFTPFNWNIAQPITLNAADDTDLTNGTAMFSVTADSGYGTASFTATEKDNDLRPTADSYVRDGTSAGSNFGTSTALQVRKSTTAGNTRWTVLKFDISSLTSITNATLRLNGKLDVTTNPSVAVQAFTASNTTWMETGVMWNNKPSASGASLGQIAVSGTTAKWYTIDLTAWLQSQKAAGKTSVALVLMSPAATTSMAVFSSDEASSNGPQLVVK